MAHTLLGVKSPESLDNRGAIANVLLGYEKAWRHWPQMLAVLTPILLPVMLIRLMLRLSAAGEDAVIVNAVVLLLPQEGLVAWVELVLTVAGWVWAVGAGIVVVAGVLRGIAVRPGVAVLAGLFRTPELGLALFLMAAGWFAVTAVSGLLGSVIAVVLVLVVAGLILARLLLAVPNIMLRGEMYGTWKHSQGRLVTIIGMTVLGVFAIPFGLLWLTDQISQIAASGAVPGAWTPMVLTVLAQTLGAVGIMAVVAGQAGTLAMAYLVRRDATDTGPVADLDAVDERLGGMAGDTVPTGRRGWAYAASLMLPALLMAGVAVANPYSTASIQSRPAGLPGSVLAIGWPEGGHPVIVTGYGAHFCHDEQCRDFTTMKTRVPVMMGHGMVAVGADGSVLEAVTSGGADSGGPFVRLGRCTAQGCERSWVPTRASSDEEASWPEVGVGAAPDGTVFIAMAVPLSPTASASTQSQVELKLLRCNDVKCAKPQRHSFGVVEGQLHPSLQGRRRYSPDIRLHFADSGWPVVTYRLGTRVWKAKRSVGRRAWRQGLDRRVGRHIIHVRQHIADLIRLWEYSPEPALDKASRRNHVPGPSGMNGWLYASADAGAFRGRSRICGRPSPAPPEPAA